MIELTFVSAWKSAVRASTGWAKLLPGTAAIAVFSFAFAFLLTQLAAVVSVSFSLMLMGFLLINLGWGPLLKRRSSLGRQVSDEIAGFRLFLQNVEQDRLNRSNSAGQTPLELDRFLPFAFALDVKEAWGDHLAQAFFTPTVFVEE
jgi:Predicted membrane protein (DUF2207)